MVDISLANVVFADVELRKVSSEDLIEELGECETAPLTLNPRRGPHERSLGPEMPRELTKSADWAGWVWEDDTDICLIDFGESFFEPVESSRLAQPVDQTVPESLFEQYVDYRGDLWRAGCIVSAQSPTVSITKHR